MLLAWLKASRTISPLKLVYPKTLLPATTNYGYATGKHTKAEVKKSKQKQNNNHYCFGEEDEQFPKCSGYDNLLSAEKLAELRKKIGTSKAEYLSAKVYNTQKKQNETYGALRKSSVAKLPKVYDYIEQMVISKVNEIEKQQSDVRYLLVRDDLELVRYQKVCVHTRARTRMHKAHTQAHARKHTHTRKTHTRKADGGECWLFIIYRSFLCIKNIYQDQ